MTASDPSRQGTPPLGAAPPDSARPDSARPGAAPLDALQRAMAALGEPQRFRLACLIRSGGLSVGELVRATGLPQPLVSHHLAVLCRAGLADVEPDGRRRVYVLADPPDPRIRTLLSLIRCEPVPERPVPELPVPELPVAEFPVPELPVPEAPSRFDPGARAVAVRDEMDDFLL